MKSVEKTLSVTVEGVELEVDVTIKPDRADYEDVYQRVDAVRHQGEDITYLIENTGAISHPLFDVAVVDAIESTEAEEVE